MVDAADYRRAEQLFWGLLSPKVRNRFPAPCWAENGHRFVYRREAENGHDFVLVDASTGEKTAAFDHAALASALSVVGGEDASAEALPIRLIRFVSERDLHFSAGGKRFHFDGLACKAQAEEDRPRHLAYSPDGQHAVEVRDGNLWLSTTEVNEARQLTFDGSSADGFGMYYDNWKGAFVQRARVGEPYPPFCALWAPNSRHLLIPRVDQRHVALYPFIESVPHDGSFRPKVHQPRIPLVGEAPATATWHVVDVVSGDVRRLDLPPDLLFVHQDAMLTRAPWWSSDGKHAFALAHGDNLARAYLFEINLESGAVRRVIEEHLPPRMDLNGCPYNPPNVWVGSDQKDVIWYSARDGWGHLYLYDGQTGAMKRQLTSGRWVVRDIVHVDEARRQVYITGAGREGGNPYYRYLYRVLLDGGEPVLLSPEPADHELSNLLDNTVYAFEAATSPISPDGKYVVYTCSTVEQPPVTVIRSLEDSALVSVLEEADATAAVAAGYRAPQPFMVKGADGQTDIHGILYKPREVSGRKSPVIVAQYTTPIAPACPKTYMRAMAGAGGRVPPAALAELGFAVITLDPRGTGFRGREIDGALDGRLHVMGMDDYAAAIAQLGHRFNWLDTDRVGIYGGSYGGFATIRALLEYPEVFKVGIATVPMGGLHTMYPDYHWFAYHGAPVYANGSGTRAEPADIPENYRNVNSAAQVDRLTGHLLLIMGELDENVLPGSTMTLIGALIEADRPFDMLMIPNANHGTISRTRHFVRRHFDYFVRHLLGEEPPRDFRFEHLPQAPEPDPMDAIW